MPFPRDEAGLNLRIQQEEAALEQVQGDDAEAHFARGANLWAIGECLKRLRKFDRAEERLGHAERELSVFPPARLLLMQARVARAAAFMNLGRWQDALDAIERALSTPEPLVAREEEIPIEDTIEVALVLRANVLDILGRKDDAWDASEVAIFKLDSTSAYYGGHAFEMLTLQGKIARSRGALDVAVQTFRRALDLPDAPTDRRWEAAYGLAAALDQREQQAEALEAWHAFLAEFRDSNNRNIQAVLPAARSRIARLSEQTD